MSRTPTLTPAFQPQKLAISVDLKKGMLKQLRFLNEVDDNPWLNTAPYIRNAIYRYENYWLPLAVKHGGLQPPLDIHWVWHVHMLAPYYYEKDCLALVGAVVQPDPPKDRQAGFRVAQKLWSQYCTEPFFVDSNTKLGDRIQKYKSKCSYDIEAATSRQKVFYYQVSLPHYSDNKFLESAVLRYRKFLFLKQQNPETFLVPCYDFDLAWHAHQLDPAAYKKDTSAILGRMYNHNDAVNDRSACSTLAEADAKTRKLWKQLFGEEFGVCGAMYRGDPPRGKLYRLNTQDFLHISTKISNVTLKSVRMDNLPEEQTFRSAVVLEDGEINKCLVKLRGPRTNFATNCRFVFDTSKHKSLILNVKRRTGFMCCGESELYASFRFALGEVVETSPMSGADNLTLQAHNDDELHAAPVPSATITAALGAWQRGPFVMKLSPGSFQSYTIPGDVEQLWGPVPLQQLPADVPNKCYVASHRWVTMATVH